MDCFTQDAVGGKAENSRDRWACTVNLALSNLMQAVLCGPQNLEAISASVLKSAKSLTGSESGFVAEIDPLSGGLTTHTQSGALNGPCDFLTEDLEIKFPEDIKYSNSLADGFDARTPFFRNNLQTRATPAPAKGSSEGRDPVYNFLSFPVQAGPELVGLIVLANSCIDFSRRHLEAVGQLAHVYALVLQRQRNSEQSRILEKQLMEAQKLEAIGVLAGGIAHDFNNILGIISGNAEILQELNEFKGSEAAPLLEDMLQACGRAKDLISRILAFSRKADCEKKTARLGFIVKDTVRLLKAAIPKNIAIDVRADVSNDAVDCDAAQISQVVLNLCTNAAQAMKDLGGTIDVSLSEITLSSGETSDERAVSSDNFLCLTVSDDGPGIDPKILGRIFEPYFTTKSDSGGSGLGLSIVHGIVKEHGGAITVDSVPGQKTGFNVFLPQADFQVETPTAQPDRSISMRARIMLVDDEPLLLRAMHNILISIGCDVATCRDATEALDVFSAYKGRFDVVITDFFMPGLTGLELTEKLKKIRPNIPVVLCTGYADETSREEFISLGVQEVAFKPVSKTRLVNILIQLLGSVGL